METATAYEVGPCPGCGQEAGTAGIVHLAWCPNIHPAIKSVGIGDPINPPLQVDVQGMPVGWICPVCGSAYSPFVFECERCKAAPRTDVAGSTDVAGIGGNPSNYVEGLQVERYMARWAARMLYEVYREARTMTREGAVIDAEMWENFEESVRDAKKALAEIARRERELK